MRAYRREWYARNAERAKAKTVQRKKELIRWFREYKSSLACIRCGENHPACLDFHHRNPGEKEIMLSRVIADRAWSKERILEEVAKCDVLCANCHRKQHWEEGRQE